MGLQHIFGLFVDPKGQWGKIRDDNSSLGSFSSIHIYLLAAIPAVSGYIGTTQVGWQIGAGDLIFLTSDTALVIAVSYYLVLLMGVFSIGWVIHLMGKAYDVVQPLSRCIILATYTATPLFLIGVMEVYPLLWLNMLIGLPALAYTVYLLYTGLPIMMGISRDRGFLFSTAVLGVCAYACNRGAGITGYILWHAAFELGWSPDHPVRSTRAQILFL